MRIILQDGKPVTSNNSNSSRFNSTHTTRPSFHTTQNRSQEINGSSQFHIHPSRSREERSKKKHKIQDDGYNSSDEYGKPRTLDFHSEEENFHSFLKEKKFELHPVLEDGNCLFRAIADQVYGDQELHSEVRKRCMEYLEKERDHFSQFITEDFSDYIKRKKKDGCFGNNLEIQVMSEMYNRRVEVYSDGEIEPLNIFQGGYETGNPPIRLSYHHGNHYNSLFDPSLPAAGVGLGLPGLEPGLADRMQMREATELSELSQAEEDVIDEIRKESDRELTQRDLEMSLFGNTLPQNDWEQTQDDIEKQVLEASLLEYWKNIKPPQHNT